MLFDQQGRADRCWIIAEVAQAHDGSLGMAHAFIEAASKAGADAVKFQTHIASAESTPGEPWRLKFSYQDETRYGYWKRMEFTLEQWRGLKVHADEKGLAFLSSPFSLEAVELLRQVGVPAWKVASGELGNPLMLEMLAEDRLPILLSTGMSPLREIDAVVAGFQRQQLPLVVMQCTTAYPCPPEKVGLNLIEFYRDRYQCGVGLSDHSGTIYPGLAASTLGIDALEVHLTLSREMFGPDVPASVTSTELKQLVEGIRFIEKMRAAPVDKDGLAEEMTTLRTTFGKSVVARCQLPEGLTLDLTHLAAKKPGGGIPASRIGELVGRRLKRSLSPNEFVREDDLES